MCIHVPYIHIPLLACACAAVEHSKAVQIEEFLCKVQRFRGHTEIAKLTVNGVDLRGFDEHLNDDESDEELFEKHRDWCFAFGPAQAYAGEAVLAQPLHADTAITNTSAIAGKYCLVRRGKNSLTEKAERAAAAGALGLIIVNTEDRELGFVANTPADPARIGIPVMMVSCSAGEELLLTATVAKKHQVEIELQDQQAQMRKKTQAQKNQAQKRKRNLDSQKQLPLLPPAPPPPPPAAVLKSSRTQHQPHSTVLAEIVGTSRTELNGTRVQMLHWSKNKGRYLVRRQRELTGRPMALKPRNLIFSAGTAVRCELEQEASPVEVLQGTVESFDKENETYAVIINGTESSLRIQCPTRQCWVSGLTVVV